MLTESQSAALLKATEETLSMWDNLETFDNGKVEFVRFNKKADALLNEGKGACITSTPFAVGLSTRTSLDPVQWMVLEEDRRSWRTTTVANDNVYHWSAEDASKLKRFLEETFKGDGLKVRIYSGEVHEYAIDRQRVTNAILDSV